MAVRLYYDLSFEDYFAVITAKRTRNWFQGWLRYLVRGVILAVFGMIVSGAIAELMTATWTTITQFVIASVLIAMALVFTIDWFFDRFVLRWFYKRRGRAGRRVELNFADDEVTWSAPGASGRMDWQVFIRAVQLPNALVVFFDPVQAFVVPARAFNTQREFEAACGYIKDRIASAARNREQAP